MFDERGFEDEAGRWWSFPSYLTMADLSAKLREVRAEKPNDRPAGESVEDFAMRRVLEWAISDELIQRRISVAYLRRFMPWPVVVRGLEVLHAHARREPAKG